MKTKKKNRIRFLMFFYVLIFTFSIYLSFQLCNRMEFYKNLYDTTKKVEAKLMERINQKCEYIISVQIITGEAPLKETLEFYSETKKLQDLESYSTNFLKMVKKSIIYSLISLVIGLIFLIQIKVKYNQLKNKKYV